MPADPITRAAGAHGSLRAEDSLVPVLVAGAEWPFAESREISITDITPMVGGTWRPSHWPVRPPTWWRARPCPA